MAGNRVYNAKRNLAFGMVNRAANMLMPFLSRTALIYILGMNYVGLNSLVSSVLQVLNLADLGIGSAIVFALYEPVEKDDVVSIRALMNYYRTVYRVIGCVIAILGFVVLPFLPSLIKGEPPKDVSITVLYLVYLANTVVSYFLFAYKQALPTAMQRVDIVSNVNTATTILLNLFQVGALLLWRNYYIFLFLIPSCTVLNNVLMGLYVNKTYPQYAPEGSITKQQRASIRKRVAGLTIQRVCATTRNSLDSVFLSAFLGLTVTAIYDNYFMIMNAITAVLGVVSTAILPTIGNSIVTDTPDKNYNDMRLMNFVYMLVAGWCACCLLCLYQPFMKLWAGAENVFSRDIVLLIVVYFYALKLGDIISLYASGAGLWWEMRWRAIAESVVNVILNYLFVRLWGVGGIIAATLISLLLVNFGLATNIIFNNYFRNGQIVEYFKDQLKYFLVAVVVCATTYLAVSFVPERDLIMLLIRAAVCALVAALLFWLIYHSTPIFHDAIGWVLGMFFPGSRKSEME